MNYSLSLLISRPLHIHLSIHLPSTIYHLPSTIYPLGSAIPEGLRVRALPIHRRYYNVCVYVYVCTHMYNVYTGSCTSHSPQREWPPRCTPAKKCTTRYVHTKPHPCDTDLLNPPFLCDTYLLNSPSLCDTYLLTPPLSM
jgi:hypothetical protein